MDLKSSVSKREKYIIVITLLVVALSIIYSFVIEPLHKEYARLKQEVVIKQAHLAKNLRLMKEKDIVKEEFKKYGQELKIKGSDEEEMASVLSEIEKIGNSTGVYLSDVKPQKIKDRDFYKIMLVEIKFQASIQTLTKFIYELQNSALLLKVSRLQVDSKGEDSSLLEGVIQVSKVSIP